MTKYYYKVEQTSNLHRDLEAKTEQKNKSLIPITERELLEMKLEMSKGKETS